MSLSTGSWPYMPHFRRQWKRRVRAAAQRAASDRRTPEVKEPERSDASGPFTEPITEASDEAVWWPVAPSGAGAAVYPPRPETGLGVARAVPRTAEPDGESFRLQDGLSPGPE
eukprot:11779916-Alexandrium_andersonii.AAC.1